MVSAWPAQPCAGYRDTSLIRNTHAGDGSNVTVSSDLGAMREQLEAIEPGSFPQYLAYLKV